MEYKRLTKLSDLGTLHALDFNGEEQTLCELTALDTDVLIGRLYELENKIESGELGDVKELKQELKAQELAANAYRIFFAEQKYWREVAELALRKATERFFDVDCLCHGTLDGKECLTCPTTKYCERDEAVQCALNNFLKESEKNLRRKGKMTELSIIDRLEKLMHDLRLEYQEYIKLREIRYEVERMQVENAVLHEKFAAMNKMPCNIGDTVYVLFGSCYRCEDDEGDHCSCEKRGKDKIFEMKVGSVRFDKDDYYLYEDPIGITSGLSCSGRNYGKTWFLSMEEAKNHLMKSYDDMLQHT